MTYYNLAVPRFHIESTRSRRRDTLVASVGLVVNNANGGLHKAYPGKSIGLGDHEDKTTVSLNLPFTLVDVPDPTPQNPDGGSISWTFLLANTSHTDSGFLTLLNNAVSDFASGAVGKIYDGGEGGAIALPIAIALLAGQQALTFLTADCDGMVAAGAHSFTAAQLLQMTHNKSWTVTEGNPGTDSPAGCGDNSIYDVTYYIERTRPAK